MDHDEPNFNGVPLDCTTIAQQLLNVENKQRSNLFPWNGQFSPQLIEVLLRTYSPLDGLVLDPFAGSGTVLCEAGRLGLQVVGAEINPAACKMAQTYRLMNLPIAHRRSLVKRLEEAIQDVLPAGSPLFKTCDDVPEDGIKARLVELCDSLSDEPAKIVLEALIVLVDFYHEATEEKVYGTWTKLKTRVIDLPESRAPASLLNCDARRLPLRDCEADFVITSPPYINVFNYHQQYRRSAEALGWDLLAVARSEIGSNRKHRQNRFLTVIQYCLDMTAVLQELRRVCKDGSRVVVIVGRESNVRKTRFFNSKIVASLAARCAGFSFLMRQERVFMNRFGEQIVEDLLHFAVRKEVSVEAEDPRAIGKEALKLARKRAPAESLADLDEALRVASEVKASPIYDQKLAYSQLNGGTARGVKA